MTGKCRLNKADKNRVPRWRAGDQNDIIWAGWNGEYVAFHRPSGATHFLNLTSKQLLEDILVEPKDAAQIATALSRCASSDDEAADPNEIQSILDRFEELGLVVRV